MSNFNLVALLFIACWAAISYTYIGFPLILAALVNKRYLRIIGGGCDAISLRPPFSSNRGRTGEATG